MPSWWPQAQADSGTACPNSVGAAANDAGWAADRYATITDDKLTTGLFYDSDGTEHTVTSGTEEISARILAMLNSVSSLAVLLVAHRCAGLGRL